MSILDQLLVAEGQACLSVVLDYYHDELLNHDKAREYLATKKLLNEDILKTYRIGFSNNTLGTHIPKYRYQYGTETRDKLKGLGIYKDNGRECHRGGIVVPIHDIAGEVVNLYSRKIIRELKRGAQRNEFDHQGVFNCQSLVGDQEIVITQDPFDALCFISHGFFNTTCFLSEEDTLARYIEYFRKLGKPRLLVSANYPALKEQLIQTEFEVYEIQLPGDCSVVEYCVQTPNPKEALAQLIRSASWLNHKQTEIEVLDTSVAVSECDLDREYERLENDCMDDDDHALDILDIFEEGTDSDTGDELDPLPAIRIAEVIAEQDIREEDNQVVVQFGERIYKVRGLYENTAHHRLKISIFLNYRDKFHIDELNLYQSRARTMFINHAQAELGESEKVIKSDIGKLIFILEDLLQKKLKEVVTVKNEQDEVTGEDKNKAIAYLQDKHLIQNILSDFAKLDLIGCEDNLLVCYLAVTSRLLDDPIAITIQSSSASGKTALMNGVLQLIPDNHKVLFSSLTSQSLYYLEETALRNKILAISELEGARRGAGAYSLKLLQSEKEISIATTLKDEKGQLRTVEKKVYGPIQFFATTTEIDVDDELLNRTLVVSISDDQAVTEAIHDIQRKKQTLDSIRDRKGQKAIVALHHAIQKLLKSVVVINPFANQLRFITSKTRTRRDHQKYLNIIKAVTFLHQYQRHIKSVDIDGEEITYIETSVEDIRIANAIAHKVLGNCLLEDLPPQSQQLLYKIHRMVREKCNAVGIGQPLFRFTRGDIGRYSGWSLSQLKTHCKRLEELEYMIKHKGGKGLRTEYELVWDGEGIAGESFAMGLVEADSLTPNPLHI